MVRPPENVLVLLSTTVPVPPLPIMTLWPPVEETTPEKVSVVPAAALIKVPSLIFTGAEIVLLPVELVTKAACPETIEAEREAVARDVVSAAAAVTDREHAERAGLIEIDRLVVRRGGAESGDVAGGAGNEAPGPVASRTPAKCAAPRLGPACVIGREGDAELFGRRPGNQAQTISRTVHDDRRTAEDKRFGGQAAVCGGQQVVSAERQIAAAEAGDVDRRRARPGGRAEGSERIGHRGAGVGADIEIERHVVAERQMPADLESAGFAVARHVEDRTGRQRKAAGRAGCNRCPGIRPRLELAPPATLMAVFPRPLPEASRKMPLETVVAPLWLLTPARVNMPLPILITLPVPVKAAGERRVRVVIAGH